MDEPQNYSLPLCRLLVNILYSSTISYILMSLYKNYIFCDVVVGTDHSDAMDKVTRLVSPIKPRTLLPFIESHLTRLGLNIAISQF